MNFSNPQSEIRNPQSSVPAIFIDRDGTMNHDIGYVSSPGELMLFPWTAEAVRLINESGFKAVVITNQSGVARGMYTEQTLRAIHDLMLEKLASKGARIDAIYYCPHHPEIGGEPYRVSCECRKPRPGMLRTASQEHNIDLARSYVIGDKASDINLAANAGAQGALVLTGYGRETLANPDRWPCLPAFVAEDLLEAVKLIFDQTQMRS